MLNGRLLGIGVALALALSACGEEVEPRGPTDKDEDDDAQSDESSSSDDDSDQDVKSDAGKADAGKADAGKRDAAEADAATPDAAPGSDAGSSSDGGTAPTGGQKFGDWTYFEVPGALCRDGSPAGYYIRRGTSDNLLIFLNGGGVCYDDFFCGINPPNVRSSLPGENLLSAVIDIGVGALLPQRQVPTETGIFKRDPRNPVADWSMVYVPYCTGDVYGGTRRDATVPGTMLKPQQFVGYLNMGLFLDHFGGAYKGKSDKVLLAGSSAGGFGSLLNFDRTQDFFGDASHVYALTDSGIPFRDMLLEPCLQKNWRALWGLDGALPKDCKGCFDPSGGGLAQGLGDYIFRQKYKGRMLGGGVSSKQDEIIKLFFSSGLKECTVKAVDEAVPAFLGLGSYPATRYPEGLTDFLDNVAGRQGAGSYIMAGSQHQHLFRDRYYQENGVGMTIADFVGKILDDEAVHVGGL